MGAISGITSSFGAHLGPERRRPHAPTPATKAESRALVLARPLRREERRTSHLPDAAFLAHLIATKGHAPQTRLYRRGAPAEAAMAYADCAARVASQTRSREI
jgi:hypothetical protein